MHQQLATIGFLFESVSRRGRPLPIIGSSRRRDAEAPGPRTRQCQSWLARDKQREVAAVHCIGSGGANKLADLAGVVRTDYRKLSGRGVVGEVGEESAERGVGA